MPASAARAAVAADLLLLLLLPLLLVRTLRASFYGFFLLRLRLLLLLLLLVHRASRVSREFFLPKFGVPEFRMLHKLRQSGVLCGILWLPSVHGYVLDLGLGFG